MVNIKVVNAGYCIICGRKIKIVTNKENEKYQNILFCPRCDERRLKSKADKEVKE